MHTVQVNPPGTGKNWVRGQNLRILSRYTNGIMCEGLIKHARSENLVVASNKKLDFLVRLQNPTLKGLQDASPLWSGTIFAYAASGEKPGTEISYYDEKSGKTFVFPVPPGYDRPDILLVAEHPHYKLRVGQKNITVVAETVFVFENFPGVSIPGVSGWYLNEPAHGIPLGDPADKNNPDAGYLHRSNGAMVSLVMRGIEDAYLGVYPSGVHMENPPSRTFGALVEKP